MPGCGCVGCFADKHLSDRLLEGGSDDYDQARLLLADSAAQNLGAPRTINLPNLPLELLHPRHRHRFQQEIYDQEKVRGTQTVLLRLTEISTPTIIQQADAGDMKTVVWAWVEPSSGALLRAQVSTKDIRIGVPSFDARIRVEFARNAKLDLLVPIEMTESFFVEHGEPGTSSARYSNYRRFDTAARIVPQ